MKQQLIRISQEEIGTEGSLVTGMWQKTALVVRNKTTDEFVRVADADQARAAAEEMAARCGGRIYRGQLPDALHAALQDYSRS